MKALIKKCLFAALIFPLTACAHYYPRGYGYYPNNGNDGGSYRGWERNYNGGWPNQNYYSRRYDNYPDHRRYPSPRPRWNHDWHRPPNSPDGWYNRYGGNRYQDGDRNHPGNHSWRQGPASASENPRYRQENHEPIDNARNDNQRWRNNRTNGQYDYHHEDHNRED